MVGQKFDRSLRVGAIACVPRILGGVVQIRTPERNRPAHSSIALNNIRAGTGGCLSAYKPVGRAIL